jgi:hypothetical protein
MVNEMQDYPTGFTSQSTHDIGLNYITLIVFIYFLYIL